MSIRFETCHRCNSMADPHGQPACHILPTRRALCDGSAIPPSASRRPWGWHRAARLVANEMRDVIFETLFETLWVSIPSGQGRRAGDPGREAFTGSP